MIGEAETARDLVGDLGDLLRDAVELAEADVQPAAAEIAWFRSAGDQRVLMHDPAARRELPARRGRDEQLDAEGNRAGYGYVVADL